MDKLLEQIEVYKKEIAAFKPGGADDLETYRIRFLGTKGIVKGLFTEMKNVPAEKKKEFGLVLNEFKQLSEAKYEESKGMVAGKEDDELASIDLTLPAAPVKKMMNWPRSILLFLPRRYHWAAGTPSA